MKTTYGNYGRLKKFARELTSAKGLISAKERVAKGGRTEGWPSGSVSSFRTIGPGLYSLAGQGRLSLSHLQWVDN
ncbi:hypothetical protein TNCV_4056001 [Trichonephila clavipes]|nr:hypothetical protein TNCV_4056001 [Trichonephila clavipes]